MPYRPNRRTSGLVAKAADLAFAVPQVVAHRVTRMALSGPNLSARDRRELQRMSAEKIAAFSESWSAMIVQSCHAHQALAVAFLGMFWSPPEMGRPSASAVAAQLQGAALGILESGMAPVHRKAVANARRLARTRGR